MNPSDARLRRLDALFAEKVLGLPTINGIVQNDLPMVSDGVFVGVSTSTLPRYTRSIDCAWEGVADWCRVLVRRGCGGSNEHEAEVVHHCGSDGMFTAQDESSPALALVLACLRAVGCTEEELK